MFVSIPSRFVMAAPSLVTKAGCRDDGAASKFSEKLD
jgi:hypothetical protein